MSDTAEQAYIEEQAVEPNPKKSFRLATVTALLDDGCAKIKFDEDEEASGKEYAYISSYHPEVNDRVLLASIGSSWVILGDIRYAAAPEEGGGGSVPELQINGVTLSGNKSSADLGLASETHTHSYSSLTNKPRINSVTVQDGNNSLADLGIAAASHSHDKLTCKTVSSVEVGFRSLNNSYKYFAPLSNTKISLGSSSFPWTGGCISGDTYLAYSSGKLSFFGNSSPKSKTTVNTCSTASSVTASTVATELNNLINALKGYGLV